MITVVRIDNPFEPHKRQTYEVPFEEGMTTADVAETASVDDLVAGAFGHNGLFLPEGESRKLSDGDFVTIVVSPGGGFEEVVLLLIKAWIVGNIAASLMPKLDEADGLDSTYSYYGFQNTYLPEGAAVPLVYGTMRAAPPCVNQSILGGSPNSMSSTDLTIARTETLNTLLAISEGPIYGLGDYTGIVQNRAEQDALVGDTVVSDGIEMLVNGISASALETKFEWRTGDQYQEAFEGEFGYMDTTQPATIYALGQEISIGTDGIDGSSGEFPAGEVSYANRIIDTDSTQFASVQLSEQSSLANIQFFFAQGLYRDGSDGTPNNQSVTMRVQYWETDAGGTAVGDVVILNPVVITNNLMSSFSADYKFPLVTPGNFTEGTAGGYLSTNTQNYDSKRTWLKLENATGLALVSPGASSFYACTWFRNYDQTASSYVSPQGVILSWTDDDSNRRGWVADHVVNSSEDGVGTWAPHSTTRNSFKGWAFVWAKIPGVAGGGRCLLLFTWDNGAWTRWRSPDFNEFGGANYNSNDTGWLHVGFAYNTENDSVDFYLNGNKYEGTRSSKTSTVVKPPCPTSGSVFSIGNFANNYADSSSQTAVRSCKMFVQGLAMLTGSPASTFFSSAANSADPYNGNANWLPSSLEGNPNAKLLYNFFTPIGSPSSGSANEYYRNYALPATSTTEAQGVHRVFVNGSIDGTFAAPQTQQVNGSNNTITSAPSHLWTSTTGVASKSFYKIEVFKDKGDGPFDTPARQDTVTVDAITTFSTQEYQYPGTALLSASLVANEEVNNSQPELTVLVHGILVPVWTEGSPETPTIERQFSRNPAWIALDLLTNRRYAMGEIFSPDGTYDLIDLESFREWANFCDEGVPDGYGTVSVFGIDASDTSASSVVFYVGLTTDAGGGATNLLQSIPETWKVGSSISFTSCSGGVPDFKTSNDVVGGLGDASNRLEITNIEPFATDTAFHNWNGYVKITANWNRGEWPGGEAAIPANIYWADEVTEDSTTITEALTTTDTILNVDDISIFSGLYWGPGHSLYYAQITSGSNEETVLVRGIESLSSSQIEVARAQDDTTAISGSSGATIALKAGNSIAQASGYETRCHFDGVFDEKKKAGWDALIEVFQAGRAMPVKAGAKLVAVVDRPRDPVALFTQANIVDGSFGISYQSAKDNPNSMTVNYLDSNHNYERRTVIVDHPSTFGASGQCSIEGIDNETECVNAGGTWTSDDNAGWSSAQYASRRNETMDARGIVRRSQATRDATYRLNRYYLQRRAAKFDVGPDAIHLLPGDRVLVSHDVPQYGYSGRIPEAGTIASNLWPSGGPTTELAPSLYHSVGTPGDGGTGGGPLWRGARAIMTVYQPEGIVPPLTAYSQDQLPDGKGVAMFRATPMNSAGTVPAGAAADGTPTPCFDQNKGSTGAYANWASQFGYPSDGAIKNDGVDLDVIASATHKSCFSVYVREPAKGATRGVLLNVYRRYDEDMGGTPRSYYGYFRWVSGALTVVGTSSGGGITATVDSTYASAGWYRAIVSVDWANITDITPAAAVGWHLQGRIYTYDYQDNGNNGYDGSNTSYGLWKGVTSIAADGNSVTWKDDGTIRRGRGQQFLAYGDPLDLNPNRLWDGDADGTGTAAWTGLNVDNTDGSSTANNAWGTFGVAPPFYPEATSSGLEADPGGKYGRVWQYYAGKTGAANYMSHRQVINLNQTTSSGLAGGANWAYHFERFNGRNGYGDFSDEPMILSFFFKKGRNGNVETKFEARLMFNNSVDSNGHANGDYAAVEITIPASSGDPSFAYTLNNASGAANPGTISWAQYDTTGATTYTGNATYAAKVRQNSTTTDSDWYYVRIAAVNNTNFRSTGTGYSGHLGVQFIMGATGGANATTTGLAQIWGVRLRGLAGDSKTEGGATTTVRYHTLDATMSHRGLEFWGPMYQSGTTTVAAYTAGATIKLDRDVTLEAGKNYEILVRQSGGDANPLLGTDLQQVLTVAADEIPSSGSKVIYARTAIEIGIPPMFVPSTGDVYSFGEAGKATEDFIVANIDTDPATLVRSIECVEYNESIYNDTAWGVLGDPTISAIGSDDGGGLAEFGFGGGGDTNPEGLLFGAVASGYRGPSGDPLPGVTLRWSQSSRSLPFEKFNIYMSQLSDTVKTNGSRQESFPQLIATCSATHREYLYTGPSLVAGREYRFRLQPVGKKGTMRSLRICPFADFSAVTNPPIPAAPTVTASLFGKKQMYKVAQSGTARDYAIEGRIGGWVVSTPAWIIDPNQDRFVSEALLPVPTNDAGSTQATIYARPKLLNGSYGNAVTVTGTEAIADVRASRQVIAENDYSAVQAVLTTELQLVAGTTDIIQWNPSSTSVAEQTYRMTEIDATTPRRTVVNAIIEGYQERPETFDDFGDATLGSELGRNWSIEGPMQDDGYNGSVKIEWRWTSGGSIGGEDFRPFEPGEIYARKMQFRLLFNRSAIPLVGPTEGGSATATGYAQTKVTRFTVIENDLPNEHFVDGGTF